MSNPSSPLPLPRLVVRVGGLGNQRLGDRNGIAEDPRELWAAAQRAVEQVLDALERVLLEIHQDLPPSRAPQHGASAPPWWQTHALGWFFGQADRWGWRRHEAQDLQVVFPDAGPHGPASPVHEAFACGGGCPH